MLTFHVVTLFPESLESYISSSILGRAIKNKKVRIKFYNPRDYVGVKNASGYKPVDARAYGGGPGMVLQAEPILRAIKKIKADKPKIIIFSPAGRQFNNQEGIKMAKKYNDIVLICGRYEGVDARVKKILKAEEISVGPYILTGGELAALILMDTTARQVEGVLGKFASLEEGRISSSEVYTRPEVLRHRGKNYRVPSVLLSGNHKEIDRWRIKKDI
ncbi:tRNA (guanosine(37)-N1)-methyltransferase TrmD [Candidatus Nomurabacteria bacterium]|nr:tRNA (guanosine(37)-N1)-methyltransferase TrmD [Candidatus Nomurabacteria bacterium]